jgi:hypothetical protein
MSGGALLLDNTSIVDTGSWTTVTTVRTDPQRAVQSHCALLRRGSDAGARPFGPVRSCPPYSVRLLGRLRR